MKAISNDKWNCSVSMRNKEDVLCIGGGKKEVKLITIHKVAIDRELEHLKDNMSGYTKEDLAGATVLNIADIYPDGENWTWYIAHCNEPDWRTWKFDEAEPYQKDLINFCERVDYTRNRIKKFGAHYMPPLAMERIKVRKIKLADGTVIQGKETIDVFDGNHRLVAMYLEGYRDFPALIFDRKV